MSEMPCAGEDQRDAVFVGGLDHFVVALRAARFDDGLDTHLGCLVDTVAGS